MDASHKGGGVCYCPYFFDEAKIGLSSQMDFFID